MSNATSPKPQRRLTSLELSAPARGALRRLKSRHGMSFTHAVERGVLQLEATLLPEPMPASDRAKLGLFDLGKVTASDPALARNGKRGAK